MFIYILCGMLVFMNKGPQKEKKIQIINKEMFKYILCIMLVFNSELNKIKMHKSKCIFTFRSGYGYRQRSDASFTAVHSEGLWDFSSHSRTNTRSRNLHLTGVNNILYGHFERASYNANKKINTFRFRL